MISAFVSRSSGAWIASRPPSTPAARREVRHPLERLEVLRPAVGIARIVERVHADEDVVRTGRLREGEREGEEDRVARRHVGDRDPAADLLRARVLRHRDVRGERRAAEGAQVDLGDRRDAPRRAPARRAPRTRAPPRAAGRSGRRARASRSLRRARWRASWRNRGRRRAGRPRGGVACWKAIAAPSDRGMPADRRRRRRWRRLPAAPSIPPPMTSLRVAPLPAELDRPHRRPSRSSPRTRSPASSSRRGSSSARSRPASAPTLHRRSTIGPGARESRSRSRSPWTACASPTATARLLFGWDEFYINFELISIARRELDLLEVRLVGPYGRLVIRRDGTLNMSDIADSMNAAAKAAPPSGPPPVLSVDALHIAGRAFRCLRQRDTAPLPLDDRARGRSISPPFATRRDTNSRYSFSGRTESGESFAWAGTSRSIPLRSTGDVLASTVFTSRSTGPSTSGRSASTCRAASWRSRRATSCRSAPPTGRSGSPAGRCRSTH